MKYGKKYECIALTEEEVKAIFSDKGIEITEIDYDMGLVSFETEDNSQSEQDDFWDCKILAAYYGVKYCYIYCEDTDQDFPERIMLLLDYTPFPECFDEKNKF